MTRGARPPAARPRRAAPPAKRSFGQNFLHDRGVLEAIVAWCRPGSGDRVIELGAGTGNLTWHLARSGAEIVAIERDRDLCPRLRERFADQPLVRVLEADAKQIDLLELAADRRIILCGNIPYHLSAPLLELAWRGVDSLERVLYMVQWELAQRLAAPTGTRACGAFSVLLQQRFEVELLRRVGRGAFTPAPRVDSALLGLTPLRPLRRPLRAPALFEEVVHAAFGQRRKQLRNALSGLFEDAAQACAQAGVDPRLRAEQLQLDDFARLSEVEGGWVSSRGGGRS